MPSDSNHLLAAGMPGIHGASGAAVIAVDELPPPNEDERYVKLTEREREVLRLVAYGYSAPEIGERLFISPKTVDTYKQRIQQKMGFSHRSNYVQFALRHGMLSPDAPDLL